MVNLSVCIKHYISHARQLCGHDTYRLPQSAARVKERETCFPSGHVTEAQKRSRLHICQLHRLPRLAIKQIAVSLSAHFVSNVEGVLMTCIDKVLTRHVQKGGGGGVTLFKCIQKCPSHTNSNHIVVNKTKCIWIIIKGIVHPKMKTLSSFTPPRVIPNLYPFLGSAEHKGRYFEESL